MRSYGLNALPIVWRRYLAHQKAIKEFNVWLPKLEEENLTILNQQESGNRLVLDSPKRIFFFWWDGLDAAPALIKMNAKHLHDLYEKDYEIVYIDKNNYRSVANIPEDLHALFLEKKITIQTFSDILRCTLISTLGGIWIDSTVYLPKRVDFESCLKKYNFYSLSTNKNMAFLSYKGKKCLWSSFLIGAGKENAIFKKMVLLYQNHFLHHKGHPPYFITDMFLMLLSVYQCNGNCQERFGKENLMSGDFSYLANHLASQNWEKDVICIGNMPQKLNWRVDILKFKKNSTIRRIYSSIIEK